jgi:hypothetical protein
MNLMEVKYDEDGNRLYFRDGIEVTEDEWMQQHPHMKGKNSGRERDSDSGRVGRSDEQVGATAESSPGEVIEQDKFQALRNQRAAQRLKVGVPQGERAGRGGDELGQPSQRPEQAPARRGDRPKRKR